MMSFGALKYFGSVTKKLKKIIVPYQPSDLHLCTYPNYITIPCNWIAFIHAKRLNLIAKYIVGIKLLYLQ